MKYYKTESGAMIATTGYISTEKVMDMTDEEIAEMEKIQAETPEEQPTQQDRIEAQVMYTALMTDTLLEESEE